MSAKITYLSRLSKQFRQFLGRFSLRAMKTAIITRPGTQVMAPEIGFLWTLPYWAWSDGAFALYESYWGPHVGFYRGIIYAFGYFGFVFVGGRWNGDAEHAATARLGKELEQMGGLRPVGPFFRPLLD
jgi:hypothetical protein